MITRSRSRSCDMSSETASVDDSPQSSQDSSSLSQLDSAPKDEYIPKKKPKRRVGPPRKPDQWVCIMPEGFQSSGPGVEGRNEVCSSIVLLRDPHTNESRQYLFKRSEVDPCHADLCEIIKFIDQPTRSWFVGNTIQTDGCLYIFTPVDPLFLALPYFLDAAKAGKFKSLDDIMEDTLCPDAFRVLSMCVRPQQWSNISDIKSAGDTSFYRLNRDRALSWLKKKVGVLAEKLEEERVYVGCGARSLALADSKQLEVTQGSFSTYACGMICDYLPTELVREMTDIYGEESVRRTATNRATEPTAKKPRLSGNSEPLEDYSTCNTLPAPPTKVKPLSASQKKLAKINTKGIKSLSNFFKKK